MPREDNTKSCLFTSVIDFGDLKTNDEFFEFIDDMCGQHTVNRLASAQNAKLHRFYSLFWYRNYKPVDAFSHSWHFENNWLVTLINLVNRVIKHIIYCRAYGTLIVTKWPLLLFSHCCSMQK